MYDIKQFLKFPSAKKYQCCIHKHVKGRMMLYQSSDIDKNKLCIHVKRFISENTDRFLYNPSCNEFQFFATPRCVAEDGSAAKCKPDSQIRWRPLRRSNPCCYLMLSHCLDLNCHWYPKCNLEAINFRWECVAIIFMVSLEIFSHLFEGPVPGWAFANLLMLEHSYQPFSESSMVK